MRPPPAYQHYAQSDANDCCNPQRRRIERSKPCNVCRKSILFRLHVDPVHPKGHADQAQYETDPLLENSNRRRLSALLFVPSLLPHTLSDIQSGFVAEVSNIFMKIASASIVGLNREYDFGRQYSACACVGHHGPPSRTVLFYIQYAFRYNMYIK
jgi:hypothetical protein